MKILHLVSGDSTSGAARGALWLHYAQLKYGIDSTILLDSNEYSIDKTISTNNSKKQKASKFIRVQINKAPNYFWNKTQEMFSYNLIGRNIKKTTLYKEADIIHLHWINHGFLSLHQLSSINKPIVWTLRDMWPLTGGCHYSMSCSNYKSNCGSCPHLKGNLKYDFSYWLNQYKRKIVEKNKITAVGISNWISCCAKESSIFKNARIETIGNVIDTDKFTPFDKDIAKSILKIINKKVISFGAQYINDTYKGMNELFSALKSISYRNDIHLLIFGNIDENMIKKLNIPYTYFGFVKDILSLNLIYSASNVFIAPSKMEAFGKTVAESMSCGTPVVAFDFSGPQDIIKHKISGYLAKPYNIKDLSAGINYVLDNNNYNDMSIAARNDIINSFSPIIISEKYNELYKSILNY